MKNNNKKNSLPLIQKTINFFTQLLSNSSSGSDLWLSFTMSPGQENTKTCFSKIPGNNLMGAV